MGFWVWLQRETIDLGERDYSRTFVISQDTTEGHYDTGHVIVDQGTETWLDKEVMNRILYISASGETISLVSPENGTIFPSSPPHL